MSDNVACEFCGEEFREGSGDLQFHWYSDHPHEVANDDEQKIHEAVAEHHARLVGIIDIEVPVTIPWDAWEDVVEYDTDGADPENVSPADVSEDTLIDLVEPEFDFRVAGREDPVRCAQCGREAAFDEASGDESD